jgi:hypothetical protein
MSRYRALAVSAVTAAVVGLAAPAAEAWDDPKITVTPSTIARGGQLTIRVDQDDCRTPGSTVSSPAFSTTQLSNLIGGVPTATVRVNQNANAGSYTVTARCNGRTFTRQNAFTVIGGVQGGLGGSSTGTTATDIAIGGGLVTAALAGGGVFLLRRHAARKA